MTVVPLVIAIAEDEWDIGSRDRIEPALAPALIHTHVILDLTAVEYLDSSALSRLVMIHRARQAQPEFAPMCLVISSPNVRKVFQLTDLDTVLKIYDTCDEAIAACMRSTHAFRPEL